MKNIKIFENNDFGEVRTVVLDNKPYLMLNDICKILEIKNVSDAKSRLNYKGVVTTEVLTNGGNQQATFINESNFYKLVFQSRKPQAEKFTDWVTTEILPSIRKHGAYLTEEKLEEVLMDPDTIIKLAIQLKEERLERERLTNKIELDKPKVLFAAAVETSTNSILIGELAKLIKQNGIDMGQNRLFEWLRNNGYLIKRKGESYNTPTQYAMELGLFETKVRAITNPNGSTKVTKTSKVTGKGQIYFVEKFTREIA